jgi:translation elongation factor EF-4
MLHMDHPGAPGARIRPGPDHHRATRDLRAAAQDRRNHYVDNPSKLPDGRPIDREPIAPALSCAAHLGNVITLCIEKRGAARHAVPRQPGAGAYDMPMNEVVLDFFDRSSPPAAAMLRWTTISTVTSRLIWSSWTC